MVIEWSCARQRWLLLCDSRCEGRMAMNLVFMDRYIPLSLPGTRKRRKETAGLDLPTTYVFRVTAQ